MKLLGSHFDIHGGGLDLVFPHHENEVAQSESYTGNTFATYWMHNGLLTKGGRKISKSDPDTIVEMRDLLARHRPDTIRALLLSSHYRRPIDYSNDRLDEVERGLQGFRNLFDRARRLTGRPFHDLPAPDRRDAGDAAATAATPEVVELRRQFLDAMDDDFNTGGALGSLFEMARAINRHADAHQLEAQGSGGPEADAFAASLAVLRELTRTLGLFLADDATAADPAADRLTAPLLELLVDLRTRLRKEKNFALADEIRNRLAALGVTLEDRPGGTGWKIDAP
jgi:cysteinyl-tRNA synthetase